MIKTIRQFFKKLWEPKLLEIEDEQCFYCNSTHMYFKPDSSDESQYQRALEEYRQHDKCYQDIMNDPAKEKAFRDKGSFPFHFQPDYYDYH